MSPAALPLYLWSERDLSSAVVELARLGGYKHYHTFDSRRSTHGFPDYVFAHARREPRLIFAELKSETGKVRPEQKEWLDALSTIPGVTVHLWRPSDLEEIAAVLTGRREREKAA